MDSASDVDAGSLRDRDGHRYINDHPRSDSDSIFHCDVDSESYSLGHCFRYIDVISDCNEYIRSHRDGNQNIDRNDHAIFYTHPHEDSASLSNI